MCVRSSALFTAVCPPFIELLATKHVSVQTGDDSLTLILGKKRLKRQCRTSQRGTETRKSRGICASRTQEKLESRQERQGGPCRGAETDR